MPTKIFTTITGKCPFGRGCDIDSQGCRDCKDYFRAGTGMFFWCNYQPPKESAESVPKSTESVSKKAESVRKTRKSVRKGTKSESEKRKRGRPPGKATKTAVNQRKSKKR